MNEIVLKVPASLRLMSLVRSTIKNYLEIEKVSNSEISKLLSVVDELATNAVEHGYDYDEKDMLVIRVIKETTKIVIEVEDFGIGFQGEGNSKEEGGMGLNIVRKIVDGIDMVKKDRGLMIRVFKYI
ncbi:MAG: ATP-binding protein [Fusobacteriaceae bacterium]|nr:ATP-binding protein [Fusobacteriaceae bacterium]MBP6466751.1 ATP-binding protein [Fusobacteriaceae bacterium]MBU9917254.1 ATP-binding protein [Fusobacteriaceae bacterium]